MKKSNSVLLKSETCMGKTQNPIKSKNKNNIILLMQMIRFLHEN